MDALLKTRDSSVTRLSRPFLELLLCVLLGSPAASALAADAVLAQKAINTTKTLKSMPEVPLASPSATAPLRILLVDDDESDNNNIPRDTRKSPSDTVFTTLVQAAVGGKQQAWATEVVPRYGQGPGLERLRPYSLIVWYTGASYGGNPDNTSVLSIKDEETVRRYLEETGGSVLLISPGYASKVLDQGSSWEQTTWPFLREVLGLQGGRGLAQRFEPGVVTSLQGAAFHVGKGGAVESQFSALNPDKAKPLFNATLKGMPGEVPVAVVSPYGKGRIVYVGFTFENLAADETTPAFAQLLAAVGAPTPAAPVAACPPGAPSSVGTAGPASVEVSGTPTSSVVRWILPGATGVDTSRAGVSIAARQALAPQGPGSASFVTSVVVERLVAGASPVKLATVSADATSVVDPGALVPGRTVSYRVTSMNGCNALGMKEASFTPPLPRDPTGLTASVAPTGSITLTWQPATGEGVAGYQVTGTSLAAPVIVRSAAQWSSPPQARGLQQWKVATLYEPGGVLTPPASWPSVNTRVLPTAGLQFLMLPNGAGSTAGTEAYSRTFCPDPFAELSACSAARFIQDVSNWEQVWTEEQTKQSYRMVTTRDWVTVSFADVLDLGTGRRVNCAPRRNGVTVCWASSHFPIPQTQKSFWDPVDAAPQGTAQAAETPAPTSLARSATLFENARSLSIIVMSDSKAFFGSWKYTGAVSYEAPHMDSLGRYSPTVEPWNALDAEHIYVTRAELQTAAELDSQGRKGVPNACLSCHGGRLDPTTNLVVGSSLLPLDPARLVFPQYAERAKQEEDMRRINQIVLQSNPAPAIVAQVNAMYGGTPARAGAVVNDAAVPSGWAQQPGLYSKVVRPYCASCHFAQRGPLNFQSWGNVLQNKAAVQRTVCKDFTMPHSEILYRKFWSEGGAVSLPGLLSSSLGFTKCPE